MPSPFPGMDPYIESPRRWGDFHSDLASKIRAQLNRQIRPRYNAQIIPHVSYDIIEIEQRRIVSPDVGVWRSPVAPTPTQVVPAVITPAPVENVVEIEQPIRYYSVEIREVESMTLVTAIEILSPGNKRPGHPTYAKYQRKRRELLRSDVHLLEIDLLRAGMRPPLREERPYAPYFVVLSRLERRPQVAVWPLQLWDRLPVLPVPLARPDPDAVLDLGAMVTSVYEDGAYEDLINYQQPPPPPPLTEEEARYVENLLKVK